jgi:hypothetical protein
VRPVNPLWCVLFTRFRPKNSEISLAIQPTRLSADQITGGSLFHPSPVGSAAIKPTSVGILPPRFKSRHPPLWRGPTHHLLG